MRIRKTLLVAGAVTTVGLASLTGFGIASAQLNSSSGINGLVEKIAQRFNLNQDEVQAIFDEEKTERLAEHQVEMSERLQDAVDNGDITAEQKIKIEDKLKELQAARETEMNEFETCAEQNNVELKYVLPVFKAGFSDDRLEEAVEDGDITAEQKTLIEQKRAELKDKRKAARETLEQWAKDNDINMKYLMIGHHIKLGGHRGPF